MKIAASDTAPLPREVSFVDLLAGRFPRSPNQLNARHEADAELIRIPGSETTLAITTDAIAEEIDTGLYDDPYLIGWMTVTVNASDLAAVGAEPLGILVNETLPYDSSQEFCAALQRGVGDASRSMGLPVLGGDTNRSSHLHMGATALGIVPDGRPVTRRGTSPGHVLFATAPVGQGTAFALLQLRGSDGLAGTAAPSTVFRPRGRLAEGAVVRGFASACMDSSDGVLTTLDELMRLNGVGFELDASVNAILDPWALAVSAHSGLPAWMMLAGPHGEFELLFTVPENEADPFLDAAANIDWRPVRIGRATEDRDLRLDVGGRNTTLDTTVVRNLFDEVGGDVNAYRDGLFDLDARLREGGAG
ncbi:MAG: thiamine-monophosphate kinase [Gemmatimonadota bacterium]|jgi:thiamine-monophosphate kinase